MADRELTPEEARHLLRRLCFAATANEELALRGLGAEAAFAALWVRNEAAAAAPVRLSATWSNMALAYAELDEAEHEARRDAQLEQHRLQIELLREAWIDQLISSPCALRETL